MHLEVNYATVAQLRFFREPKRGIDFMKLRLNLEFDKEPDETPSRSWLTLLLTLFGIFLALVGICVTVFFAV